MIIIDGEMKDHIMTPGLILTVECMSEASDTDAL